MPQARPLIESSPEADDKFGHATKRAYQSLSRVVNGMLNFGDGSKPDNIDGQWVNVTTPALINTDFTITHNLGRVPTHIFMDGGAVKSAPCEIYKGSVLPTSTQMTLRATAANVNLRFFVV